MPQPQHILEGLYREYVQLERKADILGDAQGGDALHAEGGASRPACHCLDSDRQKFLEVLGGTLQLLVGRNGVGKTQLIQWIMLLGERCLPSNSSQEQQQSVSLEDTEAYIQALDGQTWDVAIRNNLQHIETPDEYKLRQDGTLQTVRDTLRSYAHGSMPAADTPNSFILAVGNPVGSTTSSISEVKHGEAPGAIEYFKSATDMQSSAFNCFKQLTDTSRALDAVERDRLESSWRATTGQPCPAVLGSVQDVPLRTELQELAGATRLYSGHDQSLATFAGFLRASLAANHARSLMHVALARTVIFWPSEAVRVPIVDTPGTSDANSLNADVTQQAINEAMAKTSSQLLLCGEKSFETEASLADYAMQYFKHMLTSKTGRPAIKGILMPASQFFFGPSQLRSPELQAQDDERVARSMSQLRRWAEMANQDLAKHRRVSDAQLDVLLQRCEVRVVYMQLYASLCLQPAADLEELAFKAGFKANQLLMRTNGPWLMGLTQQLLAETTHPFMLSLADEHLAQLSWRLVGQIGASRKHIMSPSDSAGLFAQTMDLRKGSHELQEEHLPVMRQEIQLSAKALLEDVHGVFTELADQHKLQYSAGAGKIQAAWQTLYVSSSHSEQKQFFWDRTAQGTNRSKAFKKMFSHVELELDSSVETALQTALDTFMREDVCNLLVSHAEECLEDSVKYFDVRPLIQEAAEQAIQKSLEVSTAKLKGNMLRESTLKSCLRTLHVKCFRTHFANGPLAEAALKARQQELEKRVHSTLAAIEASAHAMFREHVDKLVKRFVVSLTAHHGQKRRRGQIDILMHKLLAQVGALAKAAKQTDGHEKLREVHHKADRLQQRVYQEAAKLLQNAELAAGQGDSLAYSVHRRALLSEQLSNDAAAAGINEALQAVNGPAVEPVGDYSCSVEIGVKWRDIGAIPMNAPAAAIKSIQPPAGFGIIPLTEDELAAQSLPAAIQRLLWPNAQGGACTQSLKMIRLVMAEQLLEDWDELQKAPKLKELHLKPATGRELGLEDYVQQILSRPHLGMLELVLFMRMLFSRCDSASEMYCQIWQPGEQRPVLLWLTPPESSQSEIESSAGVVISLMLVSLPQSKQLVWLPLSAEQAGQVDQDHAAPSCEAVNWQDCLQALDTSLVQADARKAPVKQPQQKQPVVQTSIHSYLRRKLGRGNQTAQPAESAASVLIREKRRQSPDNSTAGGSKVQRTQ